MPGFRIHDHRRWGPDGTSEAIADDTRKQPRGSARAGDIPQMPRPPSTPETPRVVATTPRQGRTGWLHRFWHRHGTSRRVIIAVGIVAFVFPWAAGAEADTPPVTEGGWTSPLLDHARVTKPGRFDIAEPVMTIDVEQDAWLHDTVGLEGEGRHLVLKIPARTDRQVAVQVSINSFYENEMTVRAPSQAPVVVMRYDQQVMHDASGPFGGILIEAPGRYTWHVDGFTQERNSVASVVDVFLDERPVVSVGPEVASWVLPSSIIGLVGSGAAAMLPPRRFT